jgi:hypothetical protein
MNHFSNPKDYYPDVVDVIITIAPDSGAMQFSLTSAVTALVPMSTYFDDNTDGTDLLASALEKQTPFTFSNEGFIGNLTTGHIFYYRRLNISGDLRVWSVSHSAGSTTIGVGDALVTGTTFKRRYFVK